MPNKFEFFGKWAVFPRVACSRREFDIGSTRGTINSPGDPTLVGSARLLVWICRKRVPLGKSLVIQPWDVFVELEASAVGQIAPGRSREEDSVV